MCKRDSGELLQSPQRRSQYSTAELCVVSSVMIDSDLVVIVQAQLDQAALV